MDHDSHRLFLAKHELLKAAIAANPSRFDRLYQLAELLLDRGEIEEGAHLYQRAYLKQPEIRPSPKLDWVKDAAFVQKSYDRSSFLIDAGHNYSAVIWAKLVAAAILGKRDEVEALVNYKALLRLENSPFREASDRSFMNGLAAEIRSGMRRHEIKGWSAIKQASRNSLIMNCGEPNCEKFAELVAGKVQDYIRYLRSLGTDNALLKDIPERISISAWCVLLDGQSRHISHIHPRAWISGVFYVGRPQPIGVSRKGWFRAGPPRAIPCDSGWEEHWIEPIPGTLALMPAYFSHETLPTYSDEERMCIAFDVMKPELARGVNGAIEYSID